MRHYQLSQNLSLDIKSCSPAFKFFVGKTNRLSLVSMSLCGIGLDFYLSRHWEYPSWEDELEYAAEGEYAGMADHQES